MTNKEYKAKKEMIDNFGYWDYYNGNDNKDLRQYHAKKMKETFSFTDKGLASVEPLKNSNYRARVYRYNDGTMVLQSYYTNVCKFEIDRETGEVIFVPLWNGYSTTTLKHINNFRALYGFSSLSKKEWIEIC